MFKKIFVSAFLCVALNAVSYGAMFSIQFENDFPFDSDDDYTNGLRLEYNWSRYGIFVDQLMYSPDNIRRDYYEPGTHPFCGYLAVGGDVTYDLKIGKRVYWLNYGELSTGLIGPSSGAEDVQKGIHKLVGAHDPKGWKYQLHDEWEIQSVVWTGIGWIMLGHEDGWNMRGDVELGGMMGTVQIAGGVNADVKFGKGCDFDRRHGEIQVRGDKKPLYLYGLCGFEGRWWGWNVFLDGNRDGDSVGVDKEIWTCALKTGCGIEYLGVVLDWYLLFGTKEYETQKHNPNYMVLRIGFRL